MATRYLTPSKVALLILALIYADGVVPSSETVSMLSILITNIIPDLPKTSHSSHTSSAALSHVINLDDLESALSSLISAIPGRTIWDLFLKRLWSIDCCHALNQIMSNAPLVVSKSRQQLQKERDDGLPSEPSPPISRTSPLGAFIRRTHLEYTRLHFSDAAALWRTFILYRRQTWQAFANKNPSDARSDLDVNLADLNLDPSHPLAQILYRPLQDGDHPSPTFMSTHDVESLMEFQVSELQRMTRSTFMTIFNLTGLHRVWGPLTRRGEIDARPHVPFRKVASQSWPLLAIPG